MALFGGLLAFAWANRYRLAPALRGADPPAARRALLVSLALQTIAGLATVAVAVVLTSLPPSIHEQPDWPFPARLSFEALAAPELRGEAIAALAGLVLAVALAGVGLAWRRRRWPAVALGLACGAAAVPHLDLLFVPAYPTSFYRSPTDFAAASIASGAALYPAACAACHGDSGAGDGPQAASLPVPPADLMASHLWDHADGELFWWLAHGMPAPSGAPAMPGFLGRLSDDALWALIDFIRARNAGAAYARDGTWPVPLRAPSFDADCPDGDEQAFGDFRGRMVWLTIVAADRVGLAAAAATTADGTACTTTGDDIVAAYAVLTGTTPAGLAGIVFLVDGEGWLRARLPPGSDSPSRLRVLQEISAHPLAPAEGGAHSHAH
jgi:mono/diheme cytochrome c family protein